MTTETRECCLRHCLVHWLAWIVKLDCSVLQIQTPNWWDCDLRWMDWWAHCRGLLERSYSLPSLRQTASLSSTFDVYWGGGVLFAVPPSWSGRVQHCSPMKVLIVLWKDCVSVRSHLRTLSFILETRKCAWIARARVPATLAIRCPLVPWLCMHCQRFGPFTPKPDFLQEFSKIGLTISKFKKKRKLHQLKHNWMNASAKL